MFIVLLMIALFLFLTALALMYISSSDLSANEIWIKFDTWMQYQCSNHRRRFLLSVIAICVFVFLTIMSLVGSDPEPIYIEPTATFEDHRGPDGIAGPDGTREPSEPRGYARGIDGTSTNGIDGTRRSRPPVYRTERTSKYASSAYQLICIDNVEYVVSAEHRSNAVTSHIDSTTGQPINCTN